jgi:hypothetical protein
VKRVALIVLAVLATLGLGGQVFADIGENFAPAGFEIYGDIYLYFAPGWIFWDFNEPQDLELGVRPGIASFIAQNLSFYVSPQFIYHKDLPASSSSWALITDAGISYYFLGDPKATTGMVPSVGVGLDLGYAQGGDLFVGLAPRLRLLYFLTDRIAPYIMLEPFFSIPISPGSGFAAENIYLAVTTYVGMSFYFPSRDFTLAR